MTEVVPSDVILLRSADDPDPYVRAFADEGLRAVCRPILEFSFSSDRALEERLRRPSAYSGVIATSPRAARALRRVFDEAGTLHADWEGMPAYAVGPKTARRFRDLHFDVRGEGSGSAAQLADEIVDADPTAPLLFLSGNRRRDELPNRLREADVPFEELVVYRTGFRSDLTLPTAREDAWLVFFSPSGLEALQRAGIDFRERYRCAAIGPTTAGALRDAGGTVEAVADHPSPEALVEAIVRVSS